jgi:hypothetical protein
MELWREVNGLKIYDISSSLSPRTKNLADLAYLIIDEDGNKIKLFENEYGEPFDANSRAIKFCENYKHTVVSVGI